MRVFNHTFKILFDYQNYFNTYICLKFLLKNIHSLWMWTLLEKKCGILFQIMYHFHNTYEYSCFRECIPTLLQHLDICWSFFSWSVTDHFFSGT